LARPGLTEVLCVSLLFLLVVGLLAAAAVLLHWAFWLMLPPVVLLWFQLVYFFRDPERTVPAEADAVLSPADGTVTHVGEVDDADFPGGRAFRISIFLSVFDVHVNRVPRSGRVVDLRYLPGCFLDARHPECARRNEQLWIDLEEDDPPRRLRVKQISGAIARRIVCLLKPGQRVQAGERFGMIKYGSRTEVLVPAGEPIDVRVKVGDKVKGCSTVLLRFGRPAQGNAR
jgi:phosphatidylserine decarboxylase